MGVFYRPPNQKEADGDFRRQLEAASHLQALVLKGHSATLISAGETTAEHKQSRSIQGAKEGTSSSGSDTYNKKELVGYVKVGCSLGCSGCEIVEFRTLTEGSKAKSRTTTMVFRRPDFGLYRDLLGRIPGGRLLERRVQES